MINRFQEIKGGDYSAMDDNAQPRQIKYSIMEDMGMEIRNSNNILEDVKNNQKQMKKIINKYNTEANPKGQKHYLEQFDRLEEENRGCFKQLKSNIDQMNTISFHKTKSHKQTKSAQIMRYEEEMRECLTIELDHSARIKMMVEEKKERLERALPRGTTADNLQRLIVNTTSQRVRNEAEDLRDKLVELDRLAASIKECKQLLDDITMLLAVGTKQMNEALEKNKEANQYLKKGNQNVRKAIQHRDKSRIKKLVIIIVAVVVLAAAGIVLWKFVPWG